MARSGADGRWPAHFPHGGYHRRIVGPLPPWRPAERQSRKLPEARLIFENCPFNGGICGVDSRSRRARAWTESLGTTRRRYFSAVAGARRSYRFEQGRIIRIDSELVHSEIVKPALGYLGEPGFEGPRDEFLKAHAHYRAGETKAAITDANNAFESTLRAVCDQRGWPCDRGAPISVLLKIVRDNGLLPDYVGNSFNQLAATLHSGLPQLRNSEGGHGQGATPRETPDFVAGYAIHLAAVKILFIVEAHKAKG